MKLLKNGFESFCITKIQRLCISIFEIAQGKIVSIYVSMSNESGMLSSVLKAIAERNGSILTINQDIPLTRYS